MKKGKENEKMMVPMYPRLHVNDKEKGGPRAPPRNKMALYEQLGIASQGFNSGFNPNHNNSATSSSAQGSENKKPMFFPPHLARSTNQGNDSNATSSDRNTSLAAPQKKHDEEHFTVPVFILSENSTSLRNSDSMDRGNASLLRPVHINRSSRNRSTHTKETKQNGASYSNLKQKDRCRTENPPCPPEDQEHREQSRNDVDRLQSINDDASLHEVEDGSRLKNVPIGVYYKDKVGYSLGTQYMDRCDDDSDTSMLDSVSVVSISPDDVVGVIGQKHFWKARREIINQQRVFAVQVFELHRLIKVQRLFAGSQNLLLEGTDFLGNRAKVPLPNQLSLEFIVKPSVNTEKCKEVQLKNPSEKPEGSPENAAGKSSQSSLEDISRHHPSNQIPLPSNHQPTPVSVDPRTNPWYFNQPTGNHWLVPVMSPTEGLIYKPYPGPGHDGPNPVISNISNPCGFPTPHPYFQGVGVPPGFPSMSHAYFPPYGMPSMCTSISSSAVDQGNHIAGIGFSEQQKSSFSGSMQKNSKRNASRFVKTREESDVQVSTTSSPLTLASPAHDMNQMRAIKVVPHNAVSANESAFRIFQSIQKEKDQFESV